MLTRSLIVAAVLACLAFPLSGAQAGSKNSSHNEKGATSHQASPGNGAVAKKADQKQAKKAKKRKPVDGDTSDYLVITLTDASRKSTETGGPKKAGQAQVSNKKASNKKKPSKPAISDITITKTKDKASPQ